MPPQLTKQTPPKAAAPQFDDVLGSGTPVGMLEDLYNKVALYGRNRIGKTTLACQWKKPLALLSIEPSPTGGARSVMNEKGVTVYRISSRPLVDPRTGKKEPYCGSQKALAIAESMRVRFARGERPFETVVIDGITAWNYIMLGEVMGVRPDDIPAILGWGKVSREQYTERSERIITHVRPFIDLPCNVVIIAQEKDHNPPKEDGKNNLTRGMQEESFFSLDISATPARWIQDACDFVGQLYQDRQIITKHEKVSIGGEVTDNVTQVDTGKLVRRLRTLYHPNYAAGVRSPVSSSVPEYIEAETPLEMYTELMKVMMGLKTSKGKY